MIWCWVRCLVQREGVSKGRKTKRAQRQTSHDAGSVCRPLLFCARFVGRSFRIRSAGILTFPAYRFRFVKIVDRWFCFRHHLGFAYQSPNCNPCCDILQLYDAPQLWQWTYKARRYSGGSWLCSVQTKTPRNKKANRPVAGLNLRYDVMLVSCCLDLHSPKCRFRFCSTVKIMRKTLCGKGKTHYFSPKT